ncbi:MAG: translocation/assembly module TamB domain-containing protein [Granulosicoccus sp.]
MIRSILKYFGIFLLLLLFTILAAAAWLAGTERGFQQTLALAKKFAPGELAWQAAEGKLGGEFEINGLQYSQTDGLDASVDAMNFKWQPATLLSTELTIDQLHLDGVTVRLPQADGDKEAETTSSSELPDIALPVSVNLADIAITNVALFPPGQDTAVEIDRVALTAGIRESVVQLDALEIVVPQGQLNLAGTMTTQDNYPMDLTANWQADIGQSTPLNGAGTFKGNLDKLQLNHQLSGFALAEINAELSDLVRSPAWDGTVKASLPNAEALSDMLKGAPGISLQTSGTPSQYKANTTITVDTTETGPVTVNADVSGSTESLQIKALVADLQDAGELSASGQLTFATLTSDIQGQWQSLIWPVQSEPQLTSTGGNFSVTGSPEEFDIKVLADVDGVAIPAGQWTASASGSATALDNFAVNGQTLGGKIAATGNATWEQQPLWDIKLVTEKLNPGLQWAGFPGSINLRASSKGQIGDDGAQLVARLDQLSGSLLEQDLNGSGYLQLAGEALTVEKLELTHGPSQMSASGMIDQKIDLDFALNSPDMSTLMPDLAGAIDLSGSLSGGRETPAIEASGSASNIVFQQNRVNSLNFNVDAGLGAKVTSTLSINATGITAGAQQIRNVSLDGQGTQEQHSVTLSADTDQGNVLTQLDGSLRENSWTGFLSALQLDNTPAGSWQLREPVAISANADEVSASLLCLDNTERLGGLCVEGNRLGTGDLTANASITELSPQLAAAYLPPDFVIDTRLNGKAAAQMNSSGDLSAEASLVLDPGKLSLETDGSTVDILLEKTTVDLSLLGDDASMELATALTDLGELTASAKISDPAGAATIVGELDADFPDITLISAFAPQLQQVSGQLLGNLSVAGTLQTPEIQGDLSLVDFNAEIPQTAMLIQDTQLSVRGIPDGTLLISGETRSGDGQLDIKGNFDPATRALDLSIDGESYRVANTAMLQVEISPKLDIELHDSGMQVRGALTIPRAYINANGGNEGIKTISASSDVVYVSEQGE